MFCKKCGSQISDDTKFCPNCGAATGENFSAAADSFFDSAGKEMNGAINDVRDTFTGGNQGGFGQPLPTNRGLFSYIVLTLVTCGIYGFYFIYKLAKDVNVACANDGDNTPGLLQYVVLTIVTCGIYAFIWQYKLANRLAVNGPRYGVVVVENGTTVLMWQLFGILLCGIGPYVAMHIIIKNTNLICSAYNRANGLGY